VTEPTRSARSRPASGRANDDVSPLDKRIIEHLQADGRRPYTQIAADLGVSEAAIRARTNRLIEHGILQVVGVTDPLKLGFHQMAMIGIRCESAKLIEVAERLAEMPEVDYVVITAGSYDLLIETVCEDNDALLAFLAERLTESGRELEGAIHRLRASYQLTDEQVTIEIAEQTVRDLMRGAEPRRVRIDDILRTVSKHYGVNRGDLLSGRRNRSIVRPRQIGMYLAKLLTSRSLPEIGRRFGNRDHTTVLHAIRKIEQLMNDDNQLREEIELLKRLLRD